MRIKQEHEFFTLKIVDNNNIVLYNIKELKIF